MNNELIERIDQEIKNLMGQRDIIERLLPNNTAVRELTQIIKVLMDCKAALSEPVASMPQDVELNQILGEYLAEELAAVAPDIDWYDGRYMDGLVSGILDVVMAGHARMEMPEGMKIEKGSDDYQEYVITSKDGTQGAVWPDDAEYALIENVYAMLTASKEKNNE